MIWLKWLFKEESGESGKGQPLQFCCVALRSWWRYILGRVWKGAGPCSHSNIWIPNIVQEGFWSAESIFIFGIHCCRFQKIKLRWAAQSLVVDRPFHPVSPADKFVLSTSAANVMFMLVNQLLFLTSGYIPPVSTSWPAGSRVSWGQVADVIRWGIVQ